MSSVGSADSSNYCISVHYSRNNRTNFVRTRNLLHSFELWLCTSQFARKHQTQTMTARSIGDRTERHDAYGMLEAKVKEEGASKDSRCFTKNSFQGELELSGVEIWKNSSIRWLAKYTFPFLLCFFHTFFTWYSNFTRHPPYPYPSSSIVLCVHNLINVQ